MRILPFIFNSSINIIMASDYHGNPKELQVIIINYDPVLFASLLQILGATTKYFLSDDCGAHSRMVIIVGNGHGDTSSNPGRDCLHFT